jgi:hypothetical protein
MFANEVKNFRGIIDKYFRNFLKRFIIMFIQQLMIVLTIKILLRKCNNWSKFVKMRLETAPYTKHHVQHQVPTFMTKIYYTSPCLRRTSHVHRRSLFLKVVAVSLMRGVLSRRWRSALPALRWKKSLWKLPQLLQLVSYKLVNVAAFCADLAGQLLMTKIRQCLSGIELPISRELQLPRRDRIRPSTSRKFFN